MDDTEANIPKREATEDSDQSAEPAETRAEQEQLRLKSANFDAIVGSTDVAIILRSLDGTILTWNRGAEAIYGYSASEAVGRPISMLVPPELRNDLAKNLEGVAKGGELDRGEWPNVTKDGKTISVTFSVFPVRDANGQVVRAIGLVRDITRAKQAEEELREYSQRLELVSRQLLKAHEEERTRIARELHDEIGQTLVTLRVKLEAMRRSRRAALFAPKLKDSTATIDQAIKQVRELSFEIRPAALDDLGLASALRSYLNQTTRQAGIHAELTAEPAATRLGRDVESTIYRAVQVAVTNVVQHAHARHLWVTLQRSAQGISAEIRDDGVGFDVSAMQSADAGEKFLGLLGMQERVRLAGGRTEIISEPGNGCTIRAIFPSARSSEEQG